jgi:hypothetical protein
MKRVLIAAIICIMAQPCVTGGVSAAGGQVDVALPPFAVSLNYQLIDEHREPQGYNRGYSEYPLLTYKGITYLPLTYAYCGLMGLELGWDPEKGLEISSRDFSKFGYFRNGMMRMEPNRASDKARLADMKITVNGKEIDNADEPYPFLLYRDITYMPLTWRFAVDEFNWRYGAADGSGLSITADSRFQSRWFTRGVYYVKGDLLIYADTTDHSNNSLYDEGFGLGGPQGQNLHYVSGGADKTFGGPEDMYGYLVTERPVWVTGDFIDFVDGKILVSWGSYWEGAAPGYYAIDAMTGEKTPLQTHRTTTENP